MAGPRVFVSHSHIDDAVTERLVADLRTAGVEIWVDTGRIQHGDFMGQINEALASCEWVVLVQTPDSLRSEAVRMEVNAALNLARLGRIRGVIPFRVVPCALSDIPPLWTTLHYYDATAGYLPALQGLLHALQTGRPQPAPPPNWRPARVAASSVRGTPMPPRRAPRPQKPREPIVVGAWLSKDTLLTLHLAGVGVILAGGIVLGLTENCRSAVSTANDCQLTHPGGDIGTLLVLIALVLYGISWVLALAKSVKYRHWGWLSVLILIYPIWVIAYGLAGPRESSLGITGLLLRRFGCEGALSSIQEHLLSRRTLLWFHPSTYILFMLGMILFASTSDCLTDSLGNRLCSYFQPGNAIGVIIALISIVLFALSWVLGVVRAATKGPLIWVPIILIAPYLIVLHCLFVSDKVGTASAVPRAD